MAAGTAINAGTYDHRDSPKPSKLEWVDQEMEREMFRSGVKKKIEPFKNNRNFKACSTSTATHRRASRRSCTWAP